MSIRAPAHCAPSKPPWRKQESTSSARSARAWAFSCARRGPREYLRRGGRKAADLNVKFFGRFREVPQQRRAEPSFHLELRREIPVATAISSLPFEPELMPWKRAC